MASVSLNSSQLALAYEQIHNRCLCSSNWLGIGIVVTLLWETIKAVFDRPIVYLQIWLGTRVFIIGYVIKNNPSCVKCKRENGFFFCVIWVAPVCFCTGGFFPCDWVLVNCLVLDLSVLSLHYFLHIINRELLSLCKNRVSKMYTCADCN